MVSFDINRHKTKYAYLTLIQPGEGMALLQYGLPQVRSVCFRAAEVGWMAD